MKYTSYTIAVANQATLDLLDTIGITSTLCALDIHLCSHSLSCWLVLSAHLAGFIFMVRWIAFFGAGNWQTVSEETKDSIIFKRRNILTKQEQEGQFHEWNIAFKTQAGETKVWTVLQLTSLFAMVSQPGNCTISSWRSSGSMFKTRMQSDFCKVINTIST